jgi:hypothetical protein
LTLALRETQAALGSEMGARDGFVCRVRLGRAMLMRRQPRHSSTAPWLAARLRGEKGWTSFEAQCWQDIGLPNLQVLAEGIVAELPLLDTTAQDQESRALLDGEVRRLESIERLIVVATAGAQVGALGRFHGVCVLVPFERADADVYYRGTGAPKTFGVTKALLRVEKR